MKSLATVPSLRSEIALARSNGASVGFVPTMGFLHEGHLSLAEAARKECDLVVMSIFVNPLQFGPGEDFDRYPKDLQRDHDLALEAGVDLLFHPETKEMYPRGEIQTRVEVGTIGEVAEGRYRPGHFAGVATVCTKLFFIVGADIAYFGRKDAQQLAVIRQIVSDLDLPIRIVACETLREPDGLAMSSRNKYLSPKQREQAPALYRGLQAAERLARNGEVRSDSLESAVTQVVTGSPGLELQYVEVVDPDTFERMPEVRGPAIIAAAVFAGQTRLIDNIAIDVGTG